MQSSNFRDYPVIVSRTDRIGDLVLSLPVLGYLKKAGFRNLFLRVSSYTQDIARLAVFNNLCSDFLVEGFEKEFVQKHSIQDSFGLYLVHRSNTLLAKKDLNMSFSVGPRTHLSSFWKFDKSLRQKRSQALKSECRYNLELAEYFAKRFQESTPSLKFGLSSLEIPQDYSTDISSPELAIVLANRGSAENLQVAQYLELCKKEIEEYQRVDFLVSGPLANETQKDLISQMGSQWNSQKFRVVKDFPNLKEFVAYLKKCRKVCASSTGPLHLAHALGVAVRGFYPSSQRANKVQSFARWRPDGYWHQAPVEFDEF